MNRIRLITVAIVVLSALLASPGPAWAAKPIHVTNDFTFVEANFCGQGIEVTVHVSNHVTIHQRVKNGVLSLSTNYSGEDTITYEPTGKTATVEYHGQSKETSVVDNGDGTVTIQQAVVGLAERVTLPDGSVLYADRGRIVFEFVLDLNGTPLDASDDIFVEDHGIVSVSGPHPKAASDFTLPCSVLPEALTTP